MSVPLEKGFLGGGSKVGVTKSATGSGALLGLEDLK